MDAEMLCPLKLEGPETKCKASSDCAWWDADIKACAILAISKRLNALRSLSALPTAIATKK